MGDRLSFSTCRTEDRTLREMADLAHSAAPAGNVNVVKDGIRVRFRDTGNLHLFPTLGIIEVSREAVLDKGRRIAEVLRDAGFPVYEVYVKASHP